MLRHKSRLLSRAARSSGEAELSSMLSRNMSQCGALDHKELNDRCADQHLQLLRAFVDSEEC